MKVNACHTIILQKCGLIRHRLSFEPYKYMRWLIPYTIPLLLYTICVQAQVRVQVIPVDSAAAALKVQNRFATLKALQDYLNDFPQQLLSKGYLSASVDRFELDSPLSRIYLFLGRRYQWGSLTVDPEYLPLAQEIGLPQPGRKKPVYVAPESDYRSIMLAYFADRGYPFASVAYDSVQLNGNDLTAKLIIDRGSLYKFDSIAQGGSLRMNPNFLYRYLGLSKGAPYQAYRFQKIQQRLDELPFAQQAQPWDLQMLGTGSVANIYLKARKSNILNVLLGLMPSSTQTPGNRLQVTGDAQILLRNSFRAGETIGLNWQQIQYRSPRLNLHYNQPYLFASKAGIDFFFELFRKDTQFVNLQVRLGMPYEFSLNRAGKILFQVQQTNVTSIDTQFVVQNRRLPDLGATTSNLLGLEYAANSTNYRLNPRRGNELSLFLVGGTKKINQSTEISGLKDPANPGDNFSFLYEALDLSTYQVRLKMASSIYFPTGKSTVLKLGLNAGTLESGNFFRNELFQIGGFKLLRGFDEESIFARRYAVLTTEYRLLSGRNSYFFGFLDGGFTQYKDLDMQTEHTYLGTGIGMVLEARNSLINLSWALGRRNDLPFDFRQSKIHVGVINFF